MIVKKKSYLPCWLAGLDRVLVLCDEPCMPHTYVPFSDSVFDRERWTERSRVKVQYKNRKFF